MGMARQYQAHEVRQMLQHAEGRASPVTGAPAHSRTLHAQATPGGTGVTPASMMQRTHKAQGESNRVFSDRGGTARTSAFANLLQQADGVCQALNSNKGQQALQAFDAAAHKAKSLRATIEFGPIREAAGLSMGQNVASMRTVHKNDAAVQKPVGGAQGIRVILDRGANQDAFMVQTCMSLDALGGAPRYSVCEMPSKAPVAGG